MRRKTLMMMEHNLKLPFAKLSRSLIRRDRLFALFDPKGLFAYDIIKSRTYFAESYQIERMTVVEN